ncbi:Acidic repeat-containing protein, partial [Tetrabaena socialis]
EEEEEAGVAPRSVLRGWATGGGRRRRAVVLDSSPDASPSPRRGLLTPRGIAPRVGSPRSGSPDSPPAQPLTVMGRAADHDHDPYELRSSSPSDSGSSSSSSPAAAAAAAFATPHAQPRLRGPRASSPDASPGPGPGSHAGGRWRGRTPVLAFPVFTSPPQPPSPRTAAAPPQPPPGGGGTGRKGGKGAPRGLVGVGGGLRRPAAPPLPGGGSDRSGGGGGPRAAAPPTPRPKPRLAGVDAAAAAALKEERARARAFIRVRVDMARELYASWNATVFGGQLPPALPIVWNSKLLATAGQVLSEAYLPGTKRRIPSRLELSPNVLTCADRLRSTLAHEMCHVAGG